MGPLFSALLAAILAGLFALVAYAALRISRRRPVPFLSIVGVVLGGAIGALFAKMARSNEHRFVICIRNDDYPASLERRKIYEALPDADAEKHNQIRVVDESGEDYLYPEEYFVPVNLPKATEEALVSAA